ncbi:MAG: 3-oxoacid CoA-transferase subunit B [Rhodospirillales bacterium]|nr:3-oxoacid CoA-transferase subunit B [Rhodospirillales bacterium]
MKGLSRDDIARRAAADLWDGAVVNLGIGLPTLVANFVPAGREIVYHSENGVLGVGPTPAEGKGDPDLINASKALITLMPGASIFHHTDSFLMIRGGHIDLALLGGMQVSFEGDLANWSTGDEKMPPAVGGAMDLAAGARGVHVLMEHTTKDGSPKIVERCTYPITAKKVVKRIYTNLAVIDVTPSGLVARELAPGVDFPDLQSKTGAKLDLANDWRPISV